MPFLRNLAIKRKLMFLMMGTSTLALLLASMAFIGYEWYAFRNELVHDLKTQAEIIAANSSAALSFGDPRRARETLQSLEAKPHLISAFLFAADGQVLAAYRRGGYSGDAPPPGDGQEGHRFGKGRIEVRHTVSVKGERLGSIFLQSDFQPMHARLQQYAGIVALVLLVSWLAAFWLSAVLQRVISQPILDLSRVTRQVSANKNYSLRVDGQSEDELGVLVSGFNEMLTQIQARDAALQKAHDELEQRVLERTKALQDEIFERELAQTALARERELLSVTLRSIGDGVIAVDRQGRVILLNAVAEKLTGWSSIEAAYQQLGQVFRISSQANRWEGENPLARMLQTEEAVELPANTLLAARDGAARLIAGSSAPIRNKDGKVIGMALAFRDITEKQRMSEELLKTSKLESLGILAGGIAHDFNNILTAILGNLSLARMSAETGHEISACLGNAEKAVYRAKDLTEQLLTFAKGGAPVKKTASVADLVRETAGFVLRGSNVSAAFECPPDLWPADVDTSQISQVIENLVINAMQAMPEGGCVELRMENLMLAGATALPLPEGPYVYLAIRDHGIGIQPQHLPKIFDPFFTTKQKGSGLGLATTYSIVKKHDGHITVESVLGQGATFHVYLPASLKTMAASSEVKATPVAGQGRILVMDDEAPIRTLLKLMLARLGYEAEAVADGAEAIQCYCAAQAAGQPFAAVIMDLTVPGGMGGAEALQKLLAIDPDITAIHSSGYSNDPVMADHRKHGFRGMIAKPYKIEDLSRVLHEVVRPSGV